MCFFKNLDAPIDLQFYKKNSQETFSGNYSLLQDQDPFIKYSVNRASCITPTLMQRKYFKQPKERDESRYSLNFYRSCWLFHKK